MSDPQDMSPNSGAAEQAQKMAMRRTRDLPSGRLYWQRMERSTPAATWKTPITAGISAERNAIGHAVSCGAKQFTAVAVVTENGVTPCGACRQVLAEFAPGMTVSWPISAAIGGFIRWLSCCRMRSNRATSRNSGCRRRSPHRVVWSTMEAENERRQRCPASRPSCSSVATRAKLTAC